MNANKVISILTAGLVFLLAVGAFVLSYNALRGMASQNGITGWQSYIWPLLIDFALVVFSLAVVRASLQGERTFYPWLLVGLYTLATITFNVLHAPGNLTAQVIAAVAPVSLFLSFELLMSQLKTGVKRHNITLTLTQLQNQTAALNLDREKLTTEIDTLTGKRERLKTDLTALRKEKRTLTATYTAIGEDTKSQALAILAERPAISGAELGRELGKSDSLGRKLRRELLPQVTNGKGVSQ